VLSRRRASLRCRRRTRHTSTHPIITRGFTASHTYSAAGVYRVRVTISDGDLSDSAGYEFVVVYDPSAGFVTGGGWILYDETSCPVLCDGSAGRADFGFVSKYQKGKTVPGGDTRFQFHAGGLVFESTSYEWVGGLGGSRAVQGRGTAQRSGRLRLSRRSGPPALTSSKAPSSNVVWPWKSRPQHCTLASLASAHV
jgi:hypothetical protein